MRGIFANSIIISNHIYDTNRNRHTGTPKRVKRLEAYDDRLTELVRNLDKCKHYLCTNVYLLDSFCKKRFRKGQVLRYDDINDALSDMRVQNKVYGRYLDQRI